MKIEIDIRSKVSENTMEIIQNIAAEAVEIFMKRTEPSMIAPVKIDGLFLVILIQDRLCKILEAKDEVRWNEVYRKAQRDSNDPTMN